MIIDGFSVAEWQMMRPTVPQMASAGLVHSISRPPRERIKRHEAVTSS